MLIDDELPAFDFTEHHRIRIAASPAQVDRALRTADLGGSWIMRALFFLRGLPAFLRRGRRGGKSACLDLNELQRHGFMMIRDEPEREMVLGVVGRFWHPTGNIATIEASQFRTFEQDGFCKAAWNFAIQPDGDSSLLSTETRIRCLGAHARKRFSAYWFFVRPFSGWIRILMLRRIRRAAEQPAS